MVISFVNAKGGTGKTTAAINLALAMAGAAPETKVALVDADPQRSCLDTLAGHERGNLSLYAAPDKPHLVIEALTEKVIVADTAGHSSESGWQVAAVSSLVVIPIGASPLDVRAVAATVKALNVIKEKFNPRLECRFLLNQMTPRTSLAGEIRATIERLYPFQVMRTELATRQAYRQSLVDGLSVIEYDRHSKAAQEITALVVEIGGLMNK